MKRGTLKKKSKQSISKIQRDIWLECKRIIRARYSKSNGKCDCYTCPARDIEGSNCHTGHMWAKASLGAYMKYDLRVLKPQCMTCNVWQGGRGADFYARMLKENGKEYMEQLERDRQVTVKAMDWYINLLEEYRKIDK